LTIFLFLDFCHKNQPEKRTFEIPMKITAEEFEKKSQKQRRKPK